jgi:putative tryptophan/tyrosine transport system substrate-binding protein
MRRRDFIVPVSGAATAWPLATRAQQPAMPVIGFLNAGAPGPFAEMMAAFSRSLSDAGFVAGHNVAIEYRWAEDQYDRLPVLATDLVRCRVAVIVAVGSPAAPAAKAATATIPIVFIVGNDPVRAGLVPSLNRPGANVTGVSLVITDVVGKRFELLAELVPNAAIIAMLINPSNPLHADTDAREAQLAARAHGRQIVLLNASNAAEIDAAFAVVAQRGAGALLFGSDILFTNQHERLAALARRHGIAAMHQWREFVMDGGLVSYGTIHAEPYHLAARYTARILKGEKPADLPVVQPTRFELIVNLKTAKTLGLEIPARLFALADEVIE